MINCWENFDKSFSYILSTFDPINKKIYYNKYSHFKIGDFYRVKNKHNGYTQEIEIADIQNDGWIELVEYGSFKWNNYLKGHNTYSITFTSMWAEDVLFEIQHRGWEFHKIKKLHNKYRKIKCWNDIKMR
jgi:hypothetical protein